MKNKQMNYDVSKAKIYKDSYRPSSNLSHFFKTLLSIIVVGNSPITSQLRHNSKRFKQSA